MLTSYEKGIKEATRFKWNCQFIFQICETDTQIRFNFKCQADANTIDKEIFYQLTARVS
jgi:hypothetical protein